VLFPVYIDKGSTGIILMERVVSLNTGKVFRCDEYLKKIPKFICSRGLRRRSAAARLLGLRVRIPPGPWLSVSFECCVLSGRGLCDRPITRPEESYRVRMCVSLSVIRCNSNPLHLQWVGRQRSEWERKRIV